MPLDKDKQPRVASLLAALIVISLIAAEETVGIIPEATFGDQEGTFGMVSKLEAYVMALLVVPFTSAVFSRSPDDLERTDHMLHGWAVVLVLLGLVGFSVAGVLGIPAKAFLFDAALVGSVLGWGFHNFQDQFL